MNISFNDIMFCICDSKTCAPGIKSLNGYAFEERIISSFLIIEYPFNDLIPGAHVLLSQTQNIISLNEMFI